MAMDERKQRLADFAAWAAKNIKGDEKGEAQIFLDRLFQAFGQGGCRDVGGQLEFRIPKASDDGGGTAFADYVWKPIVLIEMKKRGVDLAKHRRQAEEYWLRLAPGRPRYVVLCDFDEFWIYDFENQIDVPVDRVKLTDLPERYGPLAFLFRTQEKPVFGNDHIAVTRQAAYFLAECFNKLIVRKVDRALAQRFILQMLVALFAEDIGLLEQYLVGRLLEECHKPSDSYDLLGGLFAQMNTPDMAVGGRFKGVKYFNGGIFAAPARVELYEDELAQLKAAAKADWSKVRPEIFGSLFENSMEKEARHAYGAHFTSQLDILKIVRPTLVDPWTERIENASTLKELGGLLQRMQGLTVLDPACGSGNFLYIAYRELKRLEARIFERIAELSKRVDEMQRPFGFVNARQFFGMDITPFAVELAKVTMMIGRKQAIDELHVDEPALPLDNLDANFLVRDALIDEAGNPSPWPKADVIIGNPPFIGAKKLKPWRGPDYAKLLREAYPEVPGMADYCVYWFRKANELLPPCTAEDQLAGRAGLVGTQNIRNNQSRVGGLDHVVKTGTIIEAVDNQPWSGEANVHVSIANWVKTQDTSLLPKTRRLWSKIAPPAGKRRTRPRGTGPAGKDFELASRECQFINSALSDQVDVSGARVLGCNTTPQKCFNGQMLGHKGFILTPAVASRMILKDAKNKQVVLPCLIGRDLLTGTGRPSRFVIDFQAIDVNAASAYVEPFEHVKKLVLPDRQEKAELGKSKDGKPRPHHHRFLRYWWRHSFDRPELISILSGLRRYIVCSDTTKRPIFEFIAPAIRPDHKLRVFTFADDYSFGLLQSHAHWLWFVTKCSKLTERFNYTAETVYDTFPWPQTPTAARVDAVAAAGREVRRIRAAALETIKGGLRAVYRTLELPGENPLKDAHAALDAAVLAAYGFSAKGDLLGQLLELNLAVAARIERGQAVTSPGVPPSYPNPAALVTDDCIQP